MNPSEKLSVNIFSDANILALNIFDYLVSKNLFVNVVTNDYTNWKKETRGSISENNFHIFKGHKIKNKYSSTYSIFIGGFIDSKNAHHDFSEFSLLNKHGLKTLIIFPLEVFDKVRVDARKIGGNLATIFVSDLLGPHVNLRSDLLIFKTINEIVAKRQMSVGIGEIFYPLDVSYVTSLITKWLFSFGPYGKTTLILGRSTSVETFWNQNQKLVGKIKLVYDPKISARDLPNGLTVEKVNSDLSLSLTSMYGWLKNRQITAPKKNIKVKEVKPLRLPRKILATRARAKMKIPRWVKPIVILLIVLLIFPFVMLFINFSITAIGYKEFVSGSDGAAGNTILLAKTFAVVAESESKLLNYIPGINIVYKEVTFAASIVGDTDEASFHAIPVIRGGAELFANVLGNGIYDPSNQSSKIASGLFLLHTDITSMKDLTDASSKGNVILAENILTKIDFDKYINLTLEGQVLAKDLPNILGVNGIKTYLILFQNNMELRPTGGFIGSYGLVTFDSGRLSDLTVNDIYSADGQLNGHVEPPAPIKNYLGEANWWFRDSNWDPDFPTSAQRAEWFLSKEVDKSVDGVAAIDLSPIKDILGEVGSVYLPDFNLNITSENLYEKVESEVQDNSFPGTHQKASFLTALSRNLLGNLGKLNSGQKLLVLKTFYNALDTRHLQIFLHDNTSQDAISSVGWDGSVTLPNCGNGCYADTVGLVEANVGVNKANYFVQRNVNLNINISSYQIERTLVLSLKDTANPALGLSGKYKAYIRLIVPQDADVAAVTESLGQSNIKISPDITDVKDRKEVGIPVEILAGQSEDLTFSWKSNISGTLISGYLLYVRKQAGLDSLPVSLNISTPSLTEGAPYLYNAILTRDLITRFSF